MFKYPLSVVNTYFTVRSRGINRAPIRRSPCTNLNYRTLVPWKFSTEIAHDPGSILFVTCRPVGAVAKVCIYQLLFFHFRFNNKKTLKAAGG